MSSEPTAGTAADAVIADPPGLDLIGVPADAVTSPGATASPAEVPMTPSQWRQTLRRLRHDRVAMGALGFIVILALLAIFAPVVARFDPNQIAVGPRLQGFSRDHWLGTDDLGRDTFARLLYGARVSLRFSLQVVLIAVLVAVPVGIYAGYKGGVVDNIVMRIVDALASIPALILALALVGLLGPSINNAMLAIAVVMCPGFIRLIRAQALAVREETYVEASHSLGTPQRRLIMERILPNSISPLIVAASIALGSALVAESGLSLLGFGMQPPDASWGSMLDRGRSVLTNHPMQVLIPGMALALTTLAFNLFGDGLSDAMGASRQKGGPRMRGRIGLTSVVGGRSTRKADRSSNGDTPQNTIAVTGPADDAAVATSRDALLVVRDLTVEFVSPAATVAVVQDVGFEVRRGEVLGLVGESGSGKTVTSLAIMRLIPSPPGQIAAGSIEFDGTDLLALSSKEMRQLRGNDIAMVFQDPMTSLNPAFTMGDQLIEAVRLHRRVNKSTARRRALELLDMVGIPDPKRRLNDYPHQFSGGMRQRGVIAMALACEPRLLIADEPTTALDVTVQAQILELLRDLQREAGMSMIFVTHDLGVVADLCDRVAVMYAGQIVENSAVEDLFDRPQHPYAAGLLKAMPQAASAGERLNSIPGVVPSPGFMPAGCRFAPRCPYTTDQCTSQPIELVRTNGHSVRCVRSDELDFSGESR